MGGNANRLIMPVAPADLDPRLRGLVDYWSAKSAGRCCPARADLDPLDLKSLLGYLLMVDVVRQAGEGYRLRYRLFGTEFVFYHGRDLTGAWLDEIANAVFRDELLGFYRAVIAERRMQTLSYDYIMERGRQRFQAVLLPLSEDGSQVDIVLGCGVPVDA
jgi:hypothetical protein